MKKADKKLDKAFDVLFEHAAKLACEKEGKALKMPEEEHVFSKEHEEKIQKLFKYERRRKNLKTLQKISAYAACFVLVAAMVSAAMVFSVEALRVKFLNYVFDSKSEGTDFYFTDEAPPKVEHDDKEVRFGYIPDGFEITDSSQSRRRITVRYMKGEDYFQFSVSDISGSHGYDTEDGTIENTTVNGHEAVYISTPRANTLVWHDDKYVFHIFGNIDRKQITKIAENVRYYLK